MARILLEDRTATKNKERHGKRSTTKAGYSGSDTLLDPAGTQIKILIDLSKYPDRSSRAKKTALATNRPTGGMTC